MPTHGLVPVAVEEWHGWVMVNASATAPPVDEFLDGIEPHVADHEPERLVVGATHSYELATNWKLIVENYQECFHCPNIHPELCAVSPPTSGENYTGHAGLWVGGWQDLMPHAVTMSLERRVAAVPLRGLHGEARRRIDYLGVLPEHARQPAPRLRDDPPPRPDRARTARPSSASGCSRRRPSPPTGSTRRSPSTSGTSRTARTGRRARASSAACRRAGYRQGPFSTEEDAVAQFVRLVAAAYLAGGWTR